MLRRLRPVAVVCLAILAGCSFAPDRYLQDPHVRSRHAIFGQSEFSHTTSPAAFTLPDPPQPPNHTDTTR